MLNGLAHRRVEPEILDGLSADDPRAIASRRDLRRINALMFHASIMSRVLSRHVLTPPSRILEIGAGDGTFMLAVARRMAKRWPNVELTLLDRADLITAKRQEEFARLGWRTGAVVADVFDWIGNAGKARFDVVTANLFLHHFVEPDLATLLAALQPLTAAFVAAEPRRSGLALAATRLLPAIGVNDVTRHDAPASVRAGFSRTELSALWPAGAGGSVDERRAGPFTHIFAVTSERPVRQP
jgi:2-polyprenyl-3-methyl-5-hydroxy-6-metoxy-1,4-benzoquinol methylase